MAYNDSWWSKSSWWNPLARVTNSVYNAVQAVKEGDPSYLLGPLANSGAVSTQPLGSLFTSIGGGNSASSDVDVKAGFNNLITGNLDYQRQQELLNAEQAYNSAEAEKAHARSVALQENSASLERELRQSQYQDTVAGMRAAGLNPAMLYGGGTASLVSAGAPAGGAGSRASVGSRSAVHAGQSVAMIAGAMISAGALLANSALAGRFATAAATRQIGFR